MIITEDSFKSSKNNYRILKDQYQYIVQVYKPRKDRENSDWISISFHISLSNAIACLHSAIHLDDIDQIELSEYLKLQEQESYARGYQTRILGKEKSWIQNVKKGINTKIPY